MVTKKEDVPEWVSNEIQSVKFEKLVSMTKLGYGLEIYEGDEKSMLNFTNQGRMEDILLQWIYQKKSNPLIWKKEQSVNLHLIL